MKSVASRKKIATQVLIFGSVAVILFSLGVFVSAQNWDRPNSPPPVNNAGQPPQFSTDNYVKRSVTGLQSVTEPVTVGFSTSRPVYVGDPLSKSAAIISWNSTNDPAALSSVGTTGIVAYGDATALFAYAGDASNVNIGVGARSGAVDGYAAQFLGPVLVKQNDATGVSGNLTTGSTVTFQRGLTCTAAQGCSVPTGVSYWL